MESFSNRFDQQVILAVEMFVESPMSQACVLHDGGDARAGQSFGANALRRAFHNSRVRLRLVVLVVSHEVAYRMT